VYKIPKFRASALIHFPTIADAANTVIDMMAFEDTKSLTMVELLDGLMMRALNRRFRFNYAEEPTLYFEFGGDSPNVLSGQEASVRRVADRHNGGKLIYAETEEQMEELWKARKAALFASKALRPEVKVHISYLFIYWLSDFVLFFVNSFNRKQRYGRRMFVCPCRDLPIA